MQYSVSFPGGTVQYVYDSPFALPAHLGKQHCIIITDQNLAGIYHNLLSSYKTIAIPAGEPHKTWETASMLAQELLQMEAHRKSFIIGLGGGLITDITGFIASVYMRGVPFGFVPTTLLGMVDAAIGGKNGVNHGLQKNLLGTVNHPDFIHYDTAFLKTLPETEWSNGFAEIIKYACLFDPEMFGELEQHNIHHYQQNQEALLNLIQRCADWKNKIVQEDENETGQRKLLNFGHTAGHALETLYHLPHGYAVALGMLIACELSEISTGLPNDTRKRLYNLLKQYGLPVNVKYISADVMQVLKMDKKRNTETIDYILLQDIGSPALLPLSFQIIQQALENSDVRNN